MRITNETEKNEVYNPIGGKIAWEEDVRMSASRDNEGITMGHREGNSKGHSKLIQLSPNVGRCFQEFSGILCRTSIIWCKCIIQATHKPGLKNNYHNFFKSSIATKSAHYLKFQSGPLNDGFSVHKAHILVSDVIANLHMHFTPLLR